MQDKQYFEYGDEELNYLKEKDALLAELIEQKGFIKREVIPNLYEALINSILGQQISSKALETVWNRFLDRFSPLTPEHIAEFTQEELQTCGISFRKAGYICEATRRIVSGELDLESLPAKTDEEVIAELVKLPGIGEWTAQMLLIFSMERKNVLSIGDLGIQRGICNLYHHRKLTPKLYEKYKKRFSPYATIASFYLWEIKE